MPDVVEFRREGAIAVITVNHPPVNALNNAMRKGLVEALERARDDAEVKAVVLAAAGRTFIAGADITEFNLPPVSPTTIDVIETLDAMQKPVVAALHGTPLGGGLEVALGCHFRVALAGTRLGLPEIKLGLMPGAGGTQRLPRLIGMDKAMAMILSGDPIGADDAKSYGLVDEIVSDDLLSSAISFAQRVVAEKRPLTRARDRDDKLAELRANPAKFDELAAPYAKRARGLHAPAKALEALRWTLDVPVADALIRERDTFIELKNGAQSKAQRHIFFAEREAAKVAGLPKDVKPVDVKRAAVIGAGTMGGGIAMCFANAGIPVTIVETSAEALKRGLDLVAKNYAASAKRGGMSAEDVETRTGLIHGTTDIGEIADAEMVIEAVFEDIGVKREVLGKLDANGKPGAVLATNTSYLDVNEIAHFTERPQSVLGMHFFSPANVMRLLEIVRGADTDPQTLATAVRYRPQDRQGAGRGRRLPRLRRQPHPAGTLDRGGTAAARRRVAAGRRRRADRVRFPARLIRRQRSRRPRYFLAHAQGPGRTRRDRRSALRNGPLRTEDRPRASISTKRARARPSPIQRSRR